MLSTLVVILIVALACAFVLRHFLGIFRRKAGCGCDCSGCDSYTWNAGSRPARPHAPENDPCEGRGRFRAEP